MAHCLSASSCVQTQMLWSRQEKGFYVAAADTQHIWIDLVYFSKGSKKYMSVFSDVSLYWRVTQLHLDCACGKKGVRSCAGWFSRDHSNKKKKSIFFFHPLGNIFTLSSCHDVFHTHLSVWHLYLESIGGQGWFLGSVYCACSHAWLFSWHCDLNEYSSKCFLFQMFIMCVWLTLLWLVFRGAAGCALVECFVFIC